MEKTLLIEVGLADGRWAEDVSWALAGDWDLHEVVDEEVGRLRKEVLEGQLTIEALRAGVAWANALDREAVDMYGADLTVGGQRTERTARRLTHLAGRSALNSLRNSRKRIIAGSKAHQGRMFGMGVLETHDRNDRNSYN